MVNNYIKEATGDEYSAKDVRTWAGTLRALQAFSSLGEAITEAECKKNIVSVLDMVSEKLGNTRSVCKKYYVHPGLIQLYQEKKLFNYIQELNKIEETDTKTSFAQDEHLLMRILGDVIKN